MNSNSHDSNKHQDADFEDELLDLFEDLETETSSPLTSLGSFAGEIDPKVSFVSFAKNFEELLAFEEMAHPQPHLTSQPGRSQETNDLQTDLEALLQDTDPNVENEPFFPLEDPVSPPLKRPEVKPKKTQQPLAIAYYLPPQELAQYLEPAAPPSTIDWQALNQLIQEVPSIAPPVPKRPQIAISKQTDFGELEALLQEADTIGGPPLTTSTTNPSRSRTPKANAFEQTMRIPVKQLDNLSNLMGELVVNRNTLEQSQEKLRQFLDNLTGQVQQLNDIGSRLQDLYERSLLERSLLASRGQGNEYHFPAGFTDKGHGLGVNPSQAVTQEYDPLEMDQFTGFHLLSQEMIELIVRVRESSSDIEFLVDDNEQIARNLRQVSTQLQEGLTKSRMIPFSQAADRLVRPVREISLKLNKRASLNIEGREVLIDKMILEQLYDPLTHLINNAITHGIESPDVRLSRKKPPGGTVTLKAYLQGNQIVISIADDGAGIDAEAITRKALEKNLITPDQLRNLSQQDIYDFIFHAGFTTREQADDFAGRGVGMDVVRTALGSIRGTINIESELGKGTTFTIRLPLTLNICRALFCLNRHSRIALPMDGVEDMQTYTLEQIEQEGRKRYVRWRDSRLRVYPLNNLLTLQRQIGRSSIYGGASDPDQIPVVILRSAGNLLAVEVDQVLGEQEIVIKQIEGPIPKPAGISGATVLGDGTVMPVVDVLELIELAAQGRVRAKVTTWQENPALHLLVPEMVQTEPIVLIVDDSITVRELLSMSFTKAGYRVEQARDGQEAWEKLRGGLPCELVFCDIEMPRMDGLELLSRIQKDSSLKKIPVAMLTSRGADRHRQMAAELGASAYFTKPYLEEALLDAAQKMRQGAVLLPDSTRQPTQVVSELSELDTQDFEPLDDASVKVSAPRILIVDDSVTVRELLAITFQKAGYHVERARDGQDALNQLLEDPNFNLVFCDIEMPRLDGLAFLEAISAYPELIDIPVAMITSRGAGRHRKIAAERGAKAYFTKPYVEEQLLAAAGRLIAGETLLDEDGKVVT
ncbi:hybrid sensor histidine kinase/response regulator [Picosynechococcus sp. NKBG15041c]|uniref:hybrid sensor histidine kinase/response regulator n=1 Tax=Picosynechococcus sp. NKBG15041c TaxID=1407650 RepID=UPI000410BE88|nr:hybrid sensor histidine kinase/response regulator [Picosynechococcus sp. NKBG15041c]